MQELKYYADIFKAFVYDEQTYSSEISKTLKNIRLLKQTTCYPFLLHVFNDYEQKVIDEITLEKVIKFILAYLLRRMVCGVPSNSLRGLFIYLYNRVFKVTANKQKYYESINKFLFTLNSKDSVPTNNEFEIALNTSNIYSNNTLCKFLLMDIENGSGKEILNADNLTIEHIMPQTLGVGWKHIKEREHDEFLHVLGNLTVTGYNSELSNKSFLEKKKIIKENSKAIVLNEDILDKESWDIENIKTRGNRLTSKILTHYDIEPISDDTIEFEYVSVITLDDYSEVKGKKLVTFKFDGEIYRQNRYALMLQDVLKLLDEKKPGLLEDLASKDFSFSNGHPKHAYISHNSAEMRWSVEIKDGIFIESNLSAISIMRFIESVMDECGFDKSLFSISVIAEENINDD